MRRHIEDALGRSIEDALGRSIEDALGRSIEDALGRSIEDALGRSIEDALGHSFEDALGRSIEDAQFYSTQGYPHRVRLQRGLYGIDLFDSHLLSNCFISVIIIIQSDTRVSQ